MPEAILFFVNFVQYDWLDDLQIEIKSMNSGAEDKTFQEFHSIKCIWERVLSRIKKEPTKLMSQERKEAAYLDVPAVAWVRLKKG